MDGQETDCVEETGDTVLRQMYVNTETTEERHSFIFKVREVIMLMDVLISNLQVMSMCWSLK